MMSFLIYSNIEFRIEYSNWNTLRYGDLSRGSPRRAPID